VRRRQHASALKVISRNSGKRASAAPRRAARARVLRIIGGTWRGRKLRFPAAAAIRPTPDRVRETLFNWLGAATAGGRCLDAFAGSGALGLEALSRGAAHVTFIEQDAAAVAALRERLAEWGAGNALVVRADALRHLAAPPAEAYDIVFLDAAALLAHGWLREGALVYVECPARDPLPPLPASWQPLKAKQAGEVGYHLFAHAARGVTRAV
jgi:16S rRNA (guanine966-N2)-methyltransferase